MLPLFRRVPAQHPILNKPDEPRRAAAAAGADRPFVFVHVSKTGGETLLTLLGLPKDHRSAWEKKDVIAWRNWEDAWKFAVVRNPWDRLVSWYFHLRRHLLPRATMEKHVGTLGKKAPCYVLLRNKGWKMTPDEHRIVAEKLPFRRWARTVMHQAYLYDTPRWGPCGTQHEMMHAPDGSLLVDDVYKFEDGYSERVLPDVLERLGRRDLIGGIQITNNSGPPRPHYSRFYEDDEELIAWVARYFAPDVEAFGYTFERNPRP